MEFVEFKAKTIEDAITQAIIKLEVTSDKLEYEVVEKGSAGFLGFINTKPAIIRARAKKPEMMELVQKFMDDMFKSMGYVVLTQIEYNKENRFMNVELGGDNIGNLIGKRGQTLDALQHIISLYVNKISEERIKVKVDSENYRERRKELLEILSHRLASKVKRTRKPVQLEPMNAFERRIIHSALQNDKYVSTKSDGEEPYRYVVISLKNKTDERNYRTERNNK